MSDLDLINEAIKESRSILDEAIKALQGGGPKQADLHKEWMLAKMTAAGMDAFAAKYGEPEMQKQIGFGQTARKRRGGA